MDLNGLGSVIAATLGGLATLALVLVALVFVKEAVGPVGQGIGQAMTLDAQGRMQDLTLRAQAVLEAVKIQQEALDFEANNGQGAFVKLSLKGPGTVQHTSSMGGMIGAGARVAGLLPPPTTKTP